MSGPLINMQLKTKAGDVVTTVTVPSFNPPPDVIVWKKRIFVPTPDPAIYSEAFTYMVP